MYTFPLTMFLAQIYLFLTYPQSTITLTTIPPTPPRTLRQHFHRRFKWLAPIGFSIRILEFGADYGMRFCDSYKGSRRFVKQQHNKKYGLWANPGWNFCFPPYPIELNIAKVRRIHKILCFTRFSNTIPTLRRLYAGGGGGIKQFHPEIIVIW